MLSFSTGSHRNAHNFLPIFISVYNLCYKYDFSKLQTHTLEEWKQLIQH